MASHDDDWQVALQGPFSADPAASNLCAWAEQRIWAGGLEQGSWRFGGIPGLVCAKLLCCSAALVIARVAITSDGNGRDAGRIQAGRRHRSDGGGQQ